MELLKRNEQSQLKEKVLQFGEGNFLRGFVDWMIDKLNKEFDWNGGVVVVQPLDKGLINMINSQDGLYHLYLRGLKNSQKIEETRIIDCITRGINPYIDTDTFFECALNPDLRFIVSNTTEAGIEYLPGKEDFVSTTFPGRLAMFMKKRFDAGLEGFILLPCELIDKNGDKLKECILKYASDWNYGKEFENWVNNKNYFTNTLVDRIVTGYPKDDADKMCEEYGVKDNIIDTAEIFHLWVIEGEKSLSEEIPFHKIGLNVIWTDDVTPYKKRKVRILNGAHTTMVPSALLAGLDTVRNAMDDNDIYQFMHSGIFDEIIPTLDLPKEELISFANDVEERFKNPFIKHYLSSIALNSVSKFKVRVLPSILEYIKIYSSEPHKLLFSLSALIAFYKTDCTNDNPEIIRFMKNSQLPQILSNTDLWGTDLSNLLPSVQKYYDMINSEGIRNSIKFINNIK